MRRSGTAVAIDEALKVIDKGFRRHVVLKTTKNYRTHLRTYFIFCLIASKPPVDALIFSLDDPRDPHAWQVALKVDDHFTLFGMWLAGECNASRTDLHFQFSSVVDYCNGVRATVSKWWDLNLSHLQNEQLGFSTFKRGLKNVMKASKKTRLPIAPPNSSPSPPNWAYPPAGSTLPVSGPP
jgi:hypothetical protein